MKKDNVRDYATAAFRFWASVGCPTYEGAVAKIRRRALSKAGASEEAEAFATSELKKREGQLEDIRACSETFRALKASGRSYVCKAVKEIYMVCPGRPLRKNELSGRVLCFSQENFYSERQVYYFLHEAGREFAIRRGLRLEDEL